jgi:hypothetical protein
MRPRRSAPRFGRLRFGQDPCPESGAIDEDDRYCFLTALGADHFVAPDEGFQLDRRATDSTLDDDLPSW